MNGLQRVRFGDFSILQRPGMGTAQVSVHFAHATGFNAETYRELFGMLDPSIRLYAMDARGHGMSSAAANPAALRSWRPYKEDLERFVETIPQPLVLAGHSMGASVSLDLAAARPDLVQGLVLIDPVIIPPRQIPTFALARPLGLTERLIPIARLAARRRMEFASKEDAVANYVGKGAFRTWPRAWIEAYIDGGTRPTEDGRIRLTCDRAWESATFAKATVNPYHAIKRIRCPTALIARVHDGPPFTEASRNAFMKCKPDTRLVLLEEASHFMTMEHPEIAQAEIEALVGEVRSELG